MKTIYAISFSLIVCGSAYCDNLVYKPLNPSFGGDSFNSAHLLSIANAQNTYKDPSRKSETDSQSDQFVRQLESRLLSALAGDITEAIFGENPEESGRIVFGDQVIEFNRGLTSVSLTITDNSTGSVTEIEIPTFQTESGQAGVSSAALNAILGFPEQTEVGGNLFEPAGVQ